MAAFMELGVLMVGLLQAFISAFFFGSCFVPIKKRRDGEGDLEFIFSRFQFLAIFVQWIMSVGILLSGFCILPLRNFPPFVPFATIGGAMWAIGV